MTRHVSLLMNLAAIKIIEFEGIKLPVFAHLLSVAPIVAGTHNGSLEQWFIFFSACVGHCKSDSSANVSKHSAELLALLRGNPGLIQERLATRFPNADTVAIFNDWITSLEIIVARAADSESCSWFAPISIAEASDAERKLRAGMRSFGIDPNEGD